MRWRRRLARAGVAALLLALGAGRRRGSTPAVPNDDGNRSVQAREATGAKQLLLTLYRRISDDRILSISAGVTFYALLAIFPAVAALVSVYGLFANLKTMNADLSSLATLLPGGAIEIVGDQIKHVASNGSGALGLAAIAGIAISIWSANAGVKAMFDALNIVRKEPETRGFARLNAVSLAFTVAGLAIVLLAVAVVIAVPAFLKAIGWNGELDWMIDIGRWPLLWIVGMIGIALLYRFGPSRDRGKWRWISWGSALASVVWLAASILFSWYAANFGTFDKTYGSLGAVVGFMTWIWISAVIVLIGEELNETLEKLRHPHTRRATHHVLGVGGKATTRP